MNFRNNACMNAYLYKSQRTEGNSSSMTSESWRHQLATTTINRSAAALTSDVIVVVIFESLDPLETEIHSDETVNIHQLLDLKHITQWHNHLFVKLQCYTLVHCMRVCVPLYWLAFLHRDQLWYPLGSWAGWFVWDSCAWRAAAVRCTWGSGEEPLGRRDQLSAAVLPGTACHPLERRHCEVANTCKAKSFTKTDLLYL